MNSLWHYLSRFRRSRRHQRKGDAARNHRNWRLAAHHYRRHLSLNPLDQRIWVQLGHAHKEEGKLDQALEAYHEAKRLKQDDADLLLHIGHLLKAKGELSKALGYFVESAMLNPDEGTLAELQQASLTTGGGAPLAPGDGIHDLVIALGTGLQPVASHEITLRDDGSIQSTGLDPWLEFIVDPTLADAPVAALRLAAEPHDLQTPLRGRLYVDHGDGYSEKNAMSVRGDLAIVEMLIVAPRLVTRLRWDPDDRATCFHLQELSLLPLASFSAAATVLIADGSHSEVGRTSALQALKKVYAPRSPMTVADAASAQRFLQPAVDLGQLYDFWSSRFIDPASADYDRMREMIAEMAIRPFFSFVVPVFNTPLDLLDACIKSMLDQVYSDFEICLADDCSDAPGVATLLRDYADRDPRVRVAFRDSNGHIAAASNTALAMARGDFVVLVDHDDVIPDYALFAVADAINTRPDASIFYSDEDKIDLEGRRHSPYFKGEFNRFLMYGHNMVSHLGVYRREVVEQVGGFREGLEGSQDYDLFLRCYEAAGDHGVVHIPHVLYHWRTTPGSTAISHDQKSYAIVAAQRAINDHFIRTGQPLIAVDSVVLGHSAVVARPGHEAKQTVSVIICTRDRLDLLEPCLKSLRPALAEGDEIIIVDNGSIDAATLAFLDKIARSRSVIVLRRPGPFNFSSLNNAGVAAASGELLCFLNNDTETLDKRWVDRARLLLTLPDIGVVGARLLFPNRTVQHFGIGLGMAKQGVAGVLNVGLDQRDPGYFGKGRLLQQYSAVTAACMIVRREEFLALGEFDPMLAIAYNDVDLCLRYGKAGYRIVCDPDIELIHKESVSRGLDLDADKLARLDQEAAIMCERWSDVLSCDPFLSPNQDLGQTHFALAYPPRIPVPWRRRSTPSPVA